VIGVDNTMKQIENSEQVALHSLGAMIADVNHRRVSTAGSMANFNSSFEAMAGELHRIGYQIYQPFELRNPPAK
jgi:hypothetical protein